MPKGGEILLVLSPFIILAVLIALHPTPPKVIGFLVLNVVALLITVVGGFIAWMGDEIGTPGTSEVPGGVAPFAILNVAMAIVSFVYAIQLEDASNK
jgi:hypothetical protein